MYRTNEKVVRHNNNINNNRHDFSRSKPASKNNYRILYSNSLRRYGHPTTICRKDNNRTNFTSSLNNKKRENNIATRNLSCKNRNNGQVLRNEIRACWNNRRNDNRNYDNNAKKMSANKSLRIRNVNGAALKGRFFKKAGDFVGSDDVDGPPGYGPLPVKQKTSSGARISKRKNDSCCSTQSSTVTNLYSSPASSSNPRFSVPAPTPTVRTLDGEKIARKILPLSSPTSKAKIEKSPPFLSTTTTTTELCFDKRQENDAGDKRLARLLLTFMFGKRRRFLADRQILRIAAICYESGGGGNEMIANDNGPGVNFPLSNDRRFNRTTTNWLRNFLFRNPSLLRFVDGINGHYSSWQTKKLSDDEFNDCAKFCRFYF